jgi:hypothetical protein
MEMRRYDFGLCDCSNQALRLDEPAIAG